jgi:hypothetical protein
MMMQETHINMINFSGDLWRAINLQTAGDEIYYRALEILKLKALSELYNEFSIISGGFIGTTSPPLCNERQAVTMVFPEKLIGKESIKRTRGI